MNEETPQPVTVVTRNDTSLWRSAADLGAVAFAFYYLAHPDMFDRMKGWIGRQFNRTVSKFRIWDTQSEIRTLPETDEPVE